MAAQRRMMSREFRKTMLRDAAFLFLGLFAVLLILVQTLDHKQFFIAALVLVPIAAMVFNIRQRRAYAADTAGKR